MGEPGEFDIIASLCRGLKQAESGQLHDLGSFASTCNCVNECFITRERKQMEKLKGNQNVRNTETGEFANETERNDAERVVETDGEKADERSAWLKGWTDLGIEIERMSLAGEPYLADTLTVNAVIHAQVLKRPD